MGCFLLRGFVDLLRVCSLHIPSRNHFKTLLLINVQKIKTRPKYIYRRKSYLFWYHFRQVLVLHLISLLMCANKQVTRFINQSLGNFPSRYLFRKKNRPEKNCFIATNNRIVFTVPWSVKYFFAPDSPTFRKNRSEEEKDGENQQIQNGLLFKQTQILFKSSIVFS